MRRTQVRKRRISFNGIGIRSGCSLRASLFCGAHVTAVVRGVRCKDILPRETGEGACRRGPATTLTEIPSPVKRGRGTMRSMVEGVQRKQRGYDE